MSKLIIPEKSEYIEIKKSGIHNKGLFAKKDIPKKIEIIEYGGEVISEKEADKRFYRKIESANQNSEEGEIYLLDNEDGTFLDGDFDWNTAKLINHSCNPNTELTDIEGAAWFVAKRNIKKGEELTTNYGYEADAATDYPCKCGSKNCIGYIVAENQREKLKEILNKN